MPFGHVPVARAGAVWPKGRHLSLKICYTSLCDFYCETDEYEYDSAL